MTSKIRVGAVSYLNTKPLLYGIERSTIRNEIDLSVAYPSMLAKQLAAGAIDLALMPVAALQRIPDSTIVADYGIAANGPVASVCIFSRQPLQTLQHIYLDYQSRTSVALAQVLLKYYWKHSPELLQAPQDFIDLIQGDTGGVIIGDRAFPALKEFPFVYDLAEAWKAFTGMPFIFAAWIATKTLPQEFLHSFNEANATGLQHLREIVAGLNYPHYDLMHYYTENIHYRLAPAMLTGHEMFQQYLTRHPEFVLPVR